MPKTELKYGDFEPLHNKARQYISKSTGEVISLRRFQSLAHGGVPYEERTAIIKQYKKLTGKEPTQQYIENDYRIIRQQRETRKIKTAKQKATKIVLDQSILRDYMRTKAEQGTPMTEKEAKASQEFKDIMRSLKYKSNKPKGKKAQALIAIGRRASEYDWAVGETPDEETLSA